MKITWNDRRRVHSEIGYDENGQRVELNEWGDIRTVSVVLDEGEVPDMLSGSSRAGVPIPFRPETVHFQWQRHRYFKTGYGGGWASINRRQVDGWWLANAGIRGTNIKKDGTLGKNTEAALYQNDDGWRTDRHLEPPEWYLAIERRYRPDNMPSRLDHEKTEL